MQKKQNCLNQKVKVPTFFLEYHFLDVTNMSSWIVTLLFTISGYPQWPWDEIETLLILQQTSSHNRFKCAKGTLRAHSETLGCTTLHLQTPMLRWKERYVSCRLMLIGSCWSQTRMKYPQDGPGYILKKCEPTTKILNCKAWVLSLPSRFFSFLHPQTPVNPGAFLLTSTPRAEAVSEKGRETGVAGMEEVGKEEAAGVALAIQRRMSRGRDLYADANHIR